MTTSSKDESFVSTMSIEAFAGTKIAAVVVVSLVFLLVFQDKCGSSYSGSGLMKRIMSEFSKNKKNCITMLTVFVASGAGSILRGLNKTSEEERSKRIKMGIVGIVIDIFTFVILAGILLNKCRSPLWIFTPLFIFGLIMIFTLAIVAGKVASKQ